MNKIIVMLFSNWFLAPVKTSLEYFCIVWHSLVAILDKIL
jgi:hypothetical protein